MYSIEVNNLSKYYRLYEKPLDRLKEALFRKSFHQDFHSLENIAFTISMGETFGIVGDNGAGKSTLLKILAGTLSRTSGDVRITGRVAALLELGSGFHHEFTGRQNIWMNASLMGLDKAEIQHREQEIIDFSELGLFIDHPIKTYSSGMVVRLAFSIATIVDPDILIIDEALSVGDQHFQKKCIDKMVEIKNKNKIIVFCSHSLYLVNMLCDNAVWIDKGNIVKIGKAEQVTAEYENSCRQKSSIDDTSENESDFIDSPKSDETTPATSPVVIKSINLNSSPGAIDIVSGEKLVVDIEYEAYEDLEYFAAAAIKRNDELICHGAKMAAQIKTPLKGKGTGTLKLIYKGLPFCHGKFIVVVLMVDTTGMHLFHQMESEIITVHPEENNQNELGLLKLEHQWIVP